MLALVIAQIAFARERTIELDLLRDDALADFFRLPSGLFAQRRSEQRCILFPQTADCVLCTARRVDSQSRPERRSVLDDIIDIAER